MAIRNLLIKDFVLVRQPGETVTYAVEVPDTSPSLGTEAPDTVEFQGDSQNASGSITTADCLQFGGVVVGGYCTYTETYTTAEGTTVTRSYKYPVSG